MPASVREALAQAVTDHARWIVNLSECLEGFAYGSPIQCQEFVETIGTEDACSLGQWLHESTPSTESERHRTVRELHRRFHEAASAVIALALAGDADAAANLLEESLCPLSRQLVAALDEWGRTDETA